MMFRSYDSLRVFYVAAQLMSFTKAAKQLSLTKGAVSYQIKRLEQELGFTVFNRHSGVVTLTEHGKLLLHSADQLFQKFETDLSQLQTRNKTRITIGMSTYFASRWLAPRLMNFTAAHPYIGLRIQPMINLVDLNNESIDIAIRWGDGKWTDMQIEPLFNCPAIATAGSILAKQIKVQGIKKALSQTTLLHDRDDSNAWKHWHKAAKLTYAPNPNKLVIPDPNVRVEAVINNQGLALNDALITEEIKLGKLFQISTAKLDNYGYFLAYQNGALSNPALNTFHQWICSEAT